MKSEKKCDSFSKKVDSICRIRYTQTEYTLRRAASGTKTRDTRETENPLYNRNLQGGKHMKCPFCSHDNTRVVDSRPADDGQSIRRRRLCDECGRRFTTYEKVETIPLIVIKKDSTREQYDRSKIEAGVLRACYKRAISAEEMNHAIDCIETEIFNREEREIESKVIGEIVMDRLKELDAVAYVRFASVYREFKDVNTFMDELKKILE